MNRLSENEKKFNYFSTARVSASAFPWLHLSPPLPSLDSNNVYGQGITVNGAYDKSF